MKQLSFICLAILYSQASFAQKCNCADNYRWLKETIEKNDAGFQYAIEQKVEDEYQKLCKIYAEKVSHITNIEDCVEALSNWLKFFRKGYLWIGVDSDSSTLSHVDAAAIKKKFIDWKKYPYDSISLHTLLSKLR
jgi:hypothetical protein